jgi:hypothetical protein
VASAGRQAGGQAGGQVDRLTTAPGLDAGATASSFHTKDESLFIGSSGQMSEVEWGGGAT